MRIKQLFLTLALLCAVVQMSWAQDSWEEVYAMTGTTSANWTALTEGSTTGKTIGTAGATTYLHVTGNLTFSNSTLGGSGLTIQGTVYLYVPQGVTVTCKGADADGQTGAGAGIELAAGNALCLLGQGAVNATGGKAADGGDGLKGGDANWDSSNYWSGTGGNGGDGGGGAGAGIGTRGGDGGAGGAGAASVISKWSKWDHLDGGSGFAGQAGATAGAMGEVYKTNSFGSLTVTGGAAGSSGSAGGAGKSMLYDGNGYNYTTAGGGGGGAGGFGGAASNIGTGGPGGGGGGGGASGILDWRAEPGYDVVRAPGGKGGQNANGTWAAAGAESIMNHNAIKTGQVKINTSGWEDDKYNYDRYVSEQAVGTGGSGGARGSASTSESTITLNMKIPTQEEWDMVCQQTNTSQSQWCALLPGGRKGVTIGIAGTTTYYFATGDCSFTGVNAGSSGLTIKGTVYIYVPQGMTITCTGTHASGTTGAGAGIELSAGNVLYLLGKGAVNATGGNAANGANGANGRDASCDWEKIRWAWVGGDGHGGYGGGGAGAGIGTRGGDGGAGGSAAASEIYYSTWVENGVAGSAGGAGLTADAMGSLYVTESFGSLTATGGAAGSKSGSAGSAGKSCLHVYDKGITSLPGGGGGGAGGFGGAASNIGTGGPGGGGGGGGAKGSHTWAKQDFFKIFASGGGGGQNADGSFAADGGTAGVSKANVENGLCATNKKDWVKEAEERTDSDVPPATIGGSGGAAGAVSLALWPTQGMGEENSPYLISNEYEWNTFANNVSLGHDYSGQYVKLANDISVTQKCGTASGDTPQKAFSGTFDGDGYTITAAITDTGNQGTALFCYINGATIKNLKVAGTITGGMHAAAIVGTSEGKGNVIEGCVATANVIGGIYIGGTYVGGKHIGGILGHGTTSDIAIRGCVFSGMMTGGGEPKGALFGWGDNGGEKSVTNCLYLMADGQDTRGLDLVRMNSGTVSVTNCYKTTSVGTYGTQCIFTTSAPSQLGNLVRDYGVVKAYENGLHYNGKYYLSPAASTNAGTESDPYIISSTLEWDSFVQWIKEKGDSFTGEYVQLIADITVSMPAGTSEAPFGGTFLGNGHTITANISDTNNQGTALFRYINGATIKDLTVGGTITGGMHAAAIVGFAQGTGNSIRNCVATANVSGSSHIGGILGHGTDSDIAISGCVFSGTMTGGGTAKGAIVGWGESDGTKSVTDCLYLMADGQNTGGLDLVRMNEGTVTVTNSYKTTSAGSYGTQCICTNDTPSSLGTLKQDYGMVKAYATGILYDGTYYMAPAILDGYGTFETPYYIHSTYEWDSFARHVNDGTNTYSGQYVKLTSDISVSTMVGTSESNPFSGTFLGNFHTITAAISDNSNNGTALFRHINGATIKNLKVAGSITGGMHAAAIVGFAQGKGNVIEGCVATANVSGGTHIGGILGHGTDSDIAISGCVFSGTMTGGDTAKGVFFGWGDNGGTKSVTDCLYLMANGQNTDGLDLVRNNEGTVSVTNCYKTNNAGSNGKYTYAYTNAPANLGDLVKDYGILVKAYTNGIRYDDTYYVAPTSISLADNTDNSTTISNANGYLADVTLDGRTYYRDGAWNTLCLPFDATKTGLLAKAVIKELDTETAYDGHKTGFEDGTLYLNFKDAKSIVAGKPYIVKWTALSQEHIINPSGEVFAALDFITEVPTFDGGQETNWEPTQDQGPKKMVDGNTATKYGLSNANPWVDFHYTQAITPKGYALMTAEDTRRFSNRNPKSWTIKARNSGDANWTTLTTVDNTNNDKLPIENNQWTVFKLDNSTAYQYFRFEATKNSEFQLAELQFCTMEPGRTEYENPTFEGVTLQADAPTAVTSEDGKVSFTGCYNPVSIAEEDRSVLYLSDNNTLYYPNAAMTIGAFRAHFQLNGITAGEPTSPVRAFVLNFGDGERNDINASGIITTNVTNSTNSDNAWYTLDGRKLNGRSAEGRLQGKKPTRAGVYINNGKKVVIK